MTDLRPSFDYGALAPADAAETRAAAERIRVRMKRTAEDIVAIGQDLIAIKQRLPHGAFGRWLDAEFGMTDRTARMFINVADRFGKTELSSDFSPKVLCLLAAPSTDDTVIEQAQAKAEAGDKVTIADVERWKDETRAALEQADLALAERDEAIERVTALQDSITLKEREAYERARAELEAQVKAATTRANEADAAATAARARVEEAARAAREEERRAAQARHDQDAQAAVERRRAELAEVERKARVAAEQAQRSHAAREQLEADIQRHRDYLARTQAAEHEWPVMLADVEAFTSATTTMMHALHGYDHGPDARVTKEMGRAAQMARQMADALDTFCADRIAREPAA